MTDSLMMAAIDAVSDLVNSRAADTAGEALPPATWLWDCCARFTAAHQPEFRGTIHPDLSAAEANAHLSRWARALDMVDTTTPDEAAEGRRSYSATLGAATIRLTAAIDTLASATETQPLPILTNMS
ncbi:hypothetical protein IU501_14995 [Nocardia otitidiscaviarum]|uniref:hypothetical protein n=1 Tax=Nocardia otitidiscaviarum TaxID=1823 RepID=UPI0004A70A4A|nr:hypothetical protein [Nocardia otitidiscaviarum]MBF6134302.1 hypothetical protein [Nocardia otitidiscaviarum]MBF6236282.1 hypothetical protein [Nocardia otitidiscaviarum]MBF6484035.1 hypothetical protein [Nocardia otitidiscaviarum]